MTDTFLPPEKLLLKTTDELSQLLSDEEKLLLKDEEARDLVEQEINFLRRGIAEKRIQIHDLENSLIKSKENVRKRRQYIEDLTRAFWKTKRG